MLDDDTVQGHETTRHRAKPPAPLRTTKDMHPSWAMKRQSTSAQPPAPKRCFPVSARDKRQGRRTDLQTLRVPRTPRIRELHCRRPPPKGRRSNSAARQQLGKESNPQVGWGTLTSTGRQPPKRMDGQLSQPTQDKCEGVFSFSCFSSTQLLHHPAHCSLGSKGGPVNGTNGKIENPPL